MSSLNGQLAAMLLAMFCMCSNVNRMVVGSRVIEEPICLDGDFHKAKPSAEGADYAACHMFKNSSCCTADFTKQLSAKPIRTIGNFSWTTCGQLSSRCEAYMKEIECFYQCSPFVGYWKGTYKASFVGVPLCSGVCNAWFDACKSDLTCAHNWIMDFDTMANGSNSCKANTTCRNFTEVYTDGKGLCEGMWGQSFKYHVTAKPNDCMQLNFSMPISRINYDVVLNLFGKPNGGSVTSVSASLTLLTLGMSAILLLFDGRQ